MSHGHIKIESKGLCIYCKRSDLPLTDEHIVPYSLGGKHILQKASCHICADITKKFEQDVARGLWGDARISYNAPSRRKKKWKTSITLPHPVRRVNTVTIPYSEYPAPMVFYRMHQAGLLQGLPPDKDISKAWQLIAIMDDKKFKAFQSKYPGVALTAQFKHVHISFARMIAKIGYCNALCMLGIDNFRPICLPYILGEKENVSFIVGGRFNSAPPNKGLGYLLRTTAVGNLGYIMIISEVRLIADNETPTYHVVVGDVRGHEEVATVLKKLGEGQLHTYQPNVITPDFHGEHHWLPSGPIF